MCCGRPWRVGTLFLCALPFALPAQSPSSPAPAISAAAAVAQAPAATAAPPPPSPFSASLTLISQYVSRGLRQTYNHPALQGEFDYAHPSGLFLGTWMSNLSTKDIDNSILEWDLYGGLQERVPRPALRHHPIPSTSIRAATPRMRRDAPATPTPR